MPSIQYGSSAYKRTGFPELKLINLFVEQSATSENQVALQSRPGLAEVYDNGNVEVGNVFSEPGVFGGAIFSVVNGTLYRDGAAIGLVPGSGPVSIAGGYNEVLVACGGPLCSYNGTDLVDAGFVGDASNNVTAVFFINSSFVAIEANSARYYWSDPLDGRSWDVLHFVTAERQPDNLLDAAALGDNAWLFGAQSVEVHADNGGSDARFSPLETLGFDKGIKATGCVVKGDNTLFYTGSDNVVYRVAEAPQRVSDHGIEERIGNSSSVRMFAYRLTGHEFVAVRLDTETLVYDCASGGWCENQTDGGNWACACATMIGSDAYFGTIYGKIVRFSGWDDLGNALERRFTAAAPLDQPLSVDSLRLWASTGTTGLLSGQGSDPQVEMRCSDDAGETWSEWEADSLGVQGDYSQVPQWNALGMFAFPGAMFEFRVTDPVDVRVSAVKVNDPGGGR